MLESLKATRTVFTISQFLDWQRSSTLDLKPIFQRRPVWKIPAKSQFIDSVVRGYPIPIILLRQVQDLETLSMKMEVVDGQQRLRTLLAFIDPGCLPDYDQDRDYFTVRRMHNKDIADKPFSKLPTEIKRFVLGFELSTHIFPATTGDELVFRIFARLNSTGLSLNQQEIRNSEYHGAFKTLVYELSFEHLDLWRRWNLFSNDAISMMDEAEAVSEYILSMIHGITGKSTKNISKFYKEHEEELDSADVIRRRFENTIKTIDQDLGDILPNSSFQRPALFYSLFTAIYHHMYGMQSSLKQKKAISLPANIKNRTKLLSSRIRAKDLPEKVQDAMDHATGDKARREIRHKFIFKELRLEPASQYIR